MNSILKALIFLYILFGVLVSFSMPQIHYIYLAYGIVLYFIAITQTKNKTVSIILQVYILIFLLFYTLFHESIHALTYYFLTHKQINKIYLLFSHFTLEGGFVIIPHLKNVNKYIIVVAAPLLLTVFYTLILLAFDRFYDVVVLLLLAGCVVNTILPGSDFFTIIVLALKGYTLAFRILVLYLFLLVSQLVIILKSEKIEKYSDDLLLSLLLFFLLYLV